MVPIRMVCEVHKCNIFFQRDVRSRKRLGDAVEPTTKIKGGGALLGRVYRVHKLCKTICFKIQVKPTFMV